MELIFNIMKEAFPSLSHDILKLFLSLTAAGLILIAVNTFSHWVKEWITENRTLKREKREVVYKNLKPLIDITDNLISRLMEILVHHYRPTIADIKEYKPDAFADRIKNICSGEAIMNRHESTAYRLIQFFALLKHFQRETAEIVEYPLLTDIQFFASNKIPVSLHGNVYRFKFLSTELQELISSLYFDRESKLKASDYSMPNFLEVLRKSDKNQKIFKSALDCLNININPLSEQQPIDINSSVWKHIVTICHASIYLIDFYQNFANEKKWEEYRIYLVRMIKEWNHFNTVKQSYLYYLNDLKSSNYLDTYHDSIFIKYPLWKRFDTFERVKRMAKKIVLNKRGKMQMKRHHRKKFSHEGVKIHTDHNEQYILLIDDELYRVHDKLISYLTEERKIVV